MGPEPVTMWNVSPGSRMIQILLDAGSLGVLRGWIEAPASAADFLRSIGITPGTYSADRKRFEGCIVPQTSRREFEQWVTMQSLVGVEVYWSFR